MPKIELWSNFPSALRQHLIKKCEIEALPSRISTNFDSGSNQIQRFQTTNGTRILDHSNYAEKGDIRKLSCRQVSQLEEQSYSGG